MAPAPTLQTLIAVVEADAAGTDSLGRLSVAVATAGELTDASDALLDHFVDQCRRDGRSWAEISAALGVTRQAAHKRFSTTAAPTFERFTPRAKAVLTGAAEEARGLGHNYVGTEHLLLGLFGPAEGIAAKVLTQLGTSHDQVEALVLQWMPRIPHMVDANSLPHTPRVRRALERAVMEAIDLGHNYVGTEHLLLALYDDETSAASKLLRELQIDRQQCRELVVAMLAGYMQAKTDSK